eukprot:g7655.t1
MSEVQTLINDHHLTFDEARHELMKNQMATFGNIDVETGLPLDDKLFSFERDLSSRGSARQLRPAQLQRQQFFLGGALPAVIGGPVMLSYGNYSSGTSSSARRDDIDFEDADRADDSSDCDRERTYEMDGGAEAAGSSHFGDGTTSTRNQGDLLMFEQLRPSAFVGFVQKKTKTVSRLALCVFLAVTLLLAGMALYWDWSVKELIMWSGNANLGGRGSETDSWAAILPDYHHTEWAAPIENSSTQCPQKTGPLRCTDWPVDEAKPSGMKWKFWQFGPGIFGIKQQVVVPPYTILVGNADPNIETVNGQPRPQDEEHKLNFVNDRGTNPFGPLDFDRTTGKQTLILAQNPVNPGTPELHYCKARGPDEIKEARIGFVMSSHTVARNLNYQGIDQYRPEDAGILCGGAIFETTGCSYTWCDLGKEKTYSYLGYNFQQKDKEDPAFVSALNNNGAEGGFAAENVLIENIRINDVYSTSDGTRAHGNDFSDQMDVRSEDIRSSQMVFWIPDTRVTNAAGAFTKNIIVRNIIAYSTHADGLSIHSRAENVLIDNVHIQNSGADGFVLWGAGTSRNVVFKDCEMVNPGSMFGTGYSYGNCAGIYGAGRGAVVFDNFRCVTPYFEQVTNKEKHGDRAGESAPFISETCRRMSRVGVSMGQRMSQAPTPSATDYI